MKQQLVLTGCLISLVLVLTLGCAPQNTRSTETIADDLEPASENQIKTTEEGVKYLVHPDKLLSGGPPKDGIPAIDHPTFVSVPESEWVLDDADVFVLIGENSVKIYPQPIVVWHEIVNDVIDDIPVAVTYCPLCGSSIAYQRIVDGKTTTFGTTGKLYNSNLVMYDRLSDTYWTQIKGEAIIGEHTGEKLEKIPLQTMKWSDAKTRFPEALVLSRKTGYSLDYSRDPYGSYYTSQDLYFPVGQKDSRLNAKIIVIGLTLNNESKAYPEFVLTEAGKVEDVFGGVSISLEMEKDGFLMVTDRETGEKIAWERDFWFAWYAFHPNTLVYESN